MRRFLLFLLVGLFLLGGGYASAPLFAEEENSIIINEIMWAKDEYVELYNTSSDTVSLDGWQLWRQKAGSDKELIVAIPSGKEMVSHGYFLLQMPDATSLEADLSLPSNKLVDDGVEVILENSEGEVIDRVNHQGAWFAGKNKDGGISMERISPDASGEEKESWQDSSGEGGSRHGTPKANNSEPDSSHAPVARISCPTEVTVGQDIACSGEDSTDEDGDELVYAWDFGAGVLKTGIHVSHVYASVGEFTIRLTVSDGKNETFASTSISVRSESVIPDIRINEFLPNPIGSDSGNEFIELLNTGTTPISLAGWKLDDSEGGSSPYIFPSSARINPGEYFLVMSSVSRLTLNNDTDIVRLFLPSGRLHQEVPYSGSIAEGISLTYSQPTYRLSTTPTPGLENSITAPVGSEPPVDSEVTYSRDVKINEVLPNPAGSDTDHEFIEIKNYGSQPLFLSGWKLDDGEGSSSPFLFANDTVLESGGIMTLFSSQTKISLSNTGDTVRILDPNGHVADVFIYTVSHEGVSYNRTQDGIYQESTTLTAGENNVITAMPEKSSLSSSAKGTIKGVVVSAPISIPLSAIRTYKDGTLLKTKGVVSAAPGVLGTSVLYVSGSGIRVVLPKAFTKNIMVGDTIEIIGTLGTAYKERRLVVKNNTDVIVLSSGAVVDPYRISTGEVAATWEGSLVRLEGRITTIAGDSISIDDGSGQARVVILDATGIDRPRLKKGLTLAVVGIVSPGTSGYRVLPRTLADITILGDTIQAVTSKKKSSSAGRILETAAVDIAPELHVSSVLPSPVERILTSPRLVLVRIPFEIGVREVFAGCLLAMICLIRGFQMNEPLLALNGKRL